MEIKNVKVYDLEESMITSGYPMRCDLSREEIDFEIDNLSYWLSHGKFIFDFIKYQDNYNKDIGDNTKTSCAKCGNDKNVQFNSKYGKYLCSKHNHQVYKYGKVFETTPKYTVHEDYVEITIYGECLKETTVMIDLEDLPKIFYRDLNVSNYCYVHDDNGDVKLLHRFILDDIDDDIIVDHINRNKFDCRKSNLRLSSPRENTLNSSINKNNTSGVIGVSFRSDRNRWRAFITVNRKQINLGSYKLKEDAIISRLEAERIYFGEFAPQRHLFENYGIEKVAETRIKEPHSIKTLDLKQAIKHIKRNIVLGRTGIGEGHNQYQTGIRVAFDLTFSNKGWVELERYHFFDFVSSQSTMHKITKLDIKKQCNRYVWDSTIEKLQQKSDEYNNLEDKSSQYAKELYLEILYNVPSGFELTARMTTNYRQLKTVYFQRRNHRLPEWREFCSWIEENLPYFKELCITKMNDNK